MAWCRSLPTLAVLLAFLVLATLPSPFQAAGPAPTTSTDKVPPEHAKNMARGREIFTKHIRATLVENCVKCHGGGKTRAGLDMTTRESLLKGGENGVVILPGKGKDSRLYKMAAHLEEPNMPPKGGTNLNKEQLAHLLAWIDLGAPYDRPLLDKNDPGIKKPLLVTDEDRNFWSFRPLKRPSLPATKGKWGQNAIDRFILAAQEARGLAPQGPGGEADRRVLIRRAYFDLIGLPPTPDEIDAFVHDNSPTAYEKLIDHLLASPHHGERWARHWLDVVRFAESHGFEHDYDRPTAYHYRDFVIRALNKDLAYDTFVRWQLAGDELAPEDSLAITATGFLAAGVHSTQITINQVEKERYDELDDIVRTTGTAFLGLTIGCARCHDHKYDPIPTRDYYRLLSTFTTTIRADVDVELDPALARKAREEFQAEKARLEAQRTAYEKDQLPAKFDTWLAERRKGIVKPTWEMLKFDRVQSMGGSTLTPQDDGSYLATGANPGFDTYTFTSTVQTKFRALRLEALAHSSMVKGGPGRAGNGNFALSDVKVSVAPLKVEPVGSDLASLGKAAKSVPVKLIKARATFEQKGLPVAASIDNDPRSAWAIDPQFGKNHAAAFEFESPVGFEGGTILTVTLSFNNNAGHNIGRPRLSISATPDAPLQAEVLPAEVRIALDKLTDPKHGLAPADRTTLLTWFRTTEPGWRALQTQIDEHARKGAVTGKTKALICSEGLPPIRLHSQGADFLEQTHFLKRGDPNQKDGVANQGFLQVLMKSPEGEKHWQETPPPGARTSYRRRSLANWITDVDQGAGHLLARVIVNRLWQYHFGQGIVATPGDFGLQGDRPSHPELLDYLASELIANGWKLKPIHKLIMLSATYRQGTQFDKAKSAIDPDNRLHWRRTPRRLEAEAIRDSLLAVGGELDTRMFGPGTLDQKHRRRAIYFFVKRSQLVPMMVLFDAPDGLQGIDQRPTTTIAPQALLMMNNEVVRQSAKGLALRVKEQVNKSPAAGITSAYKWAVGRAPTERELTNSVTFFEEQTRSYREEGKTDPGDLALTDLCQVLLGLNEFVYID